jgi:hypothetical protein
VYTNLIRRGDQVKDTTFLSTSAVRGGEGGASGWGRPGTRAVPPSTTSSTAPAGDTSPSTPWSREREKFCSRTTPSSASIGSCPPTPSPAVYLTEVPNPGAVATEGPWSGL